MADNEEREEAASRGNGWEVVSLTSSAYAVAPDSELVNPNDVSGHKIENSEAMFMSGHFVFPPNQHENLPLEPENVEVGNTQEAGESFSRLDLEEEDNLDDRELDEANEIEKEQIMASALKFGFSYSDETTRGRSTTYDESTVIPGEIEPSERFSDSKISKSSNKAEEDDVDDNSGLPCEAWWKRGAASLYSQAKEANSFWSIFVAAAVVGLVVWGRRLHREKLEVLHHKWRLSFDSEKLKRSFGPLSRFKAYIESGSHRDSSIHDTSFIG